MDLFRVKMKVKLLSAAVILLVYFSHITEAHNTHYAVDGHTYESPHIVHLDHARQRREATAAPATTSMSSSKPEVQTAAAAASSPQPSGAPAVANATEPATNATDDSNRTTNVAKTTPAVPTTAVVTQVPILGANGTGQQWTNLTANVPKVSDPISSSDDNLTDVFETPEKIKAEQHLANLTYDHHDFYNSTFIGNPDYFREYWANISQSQADVHSMLSNSHRRATNVQLKFKFPFYGSWVDSITVATGGFIYTGEHTHAWLAATQYIAPLMANFDTSLNNDSVVRLADDGEKFTAFWENVTLRESPNMKFTFAATLHKNGDIVFAYKSIPIPVSKIDDSAHPVKIGISDAYLTDRVIFYVRRKTIYEYHRVTFKHYEIGNNTILKLVALPTCLQYDTCTDCLNHNTGFDCAWCENIKKCSSGTDRNKQDWQLRNCDKSLVGNVSSCTPKVSGDTTAYETDSAPDPRHEAVLNTLNTTEPTVKPAQTSALAATGGRSAVGGAVAALVAVAVVASLGAWVLYAFKNPHTRSGQILIRYRPSQWSWRRGEARYTAATIHM